MFQLPQAVSFGVRPVFRHSTHNMRNFELKMASFIKHTFTRSIISQEISSPEKHCVLPLLAAKLRR